MTGSKHFDKIAWTIIAFVLIITILFMNGTSLGLEVMAKTLGYEDRLFDNTRVHTLDIVMNDWDEFIANAETEEYYVANVVIDGEAYKNVAIRGKGNTSLSTVSSLGSERYSFKIEFDHYDSSISYHGLDKLSLNNLIQDSTMMKDYLTYTMMNEFGAASPLCSFVYITVNGEDWGLYLAVEGVEDSFLTRNYGSDYGELYKPDSLSFGGGRGNGMDFNMDDFMNRDENTGDSTGNVTPGGFDPSAMFGNGGFDFSAMPQGGMPDMGNTQIPDFSSGEMPEGFDSATVPGNFDPSSMFGAGDDKGSDRGGFGGFGMGASDVKLQYIDDQLSSYSNIWNNAKTDITEADQLRLIESLKKLSNGEEIESVVDIEQVIRYFVVHNFVCNGDSYTGSMIHNYYLYEEDGQLAMLPWDYNLAYGTFSGGNASGTVNTPIDSPVSGGSSDRPMLNWIVENAEYTQMYHQYFAEFLETVDAEAIIDNAYNLIGEYVKKDPTAFYTYEEFELGVETLRSFCRMRSESIAQQLENGETVNDMGYVDASSITLSDMGSMSGMGGFGGGGMPGRGDSDTQVPQDFDMSQLPDGFDASQFPGSFDGNVTTEETPDGQKNPVQPGETAGEQSETESTPQNNRPSRSETKVPGGDMGFNIGGAGTSSDYSTLIWVIVCAVVLIAGLVIAKLYKR